MELLVHQTIHVFSEERLHRAQRDEHHLALRGVDQIVVGELGALQEHIPLLLSDLGVDGEGFCQTLVRGELVTHHRARLVDGDRATEDRSVLGDSFHLGVDVRFERLTVVDETAARNEPEACHDEQK